MCCCVNNSLLVYCSRQFIEFINDIHDLLWELYIGTGGRVYLHVHVGGMHVHACTGKCECLQHVHVTIVAADIVSCSFHLFSSKPTPKIICYAEMFGNVYLMDNAMETEAGTPLVSAAVLFQA